jgi:enterochelin esterase family protein
MKPAEKKHRARSAMNIQAPETALGQTHAGQDGLLPDLRRFLDAGDKSATAVDAFLEGRPTPVAEPGALTFLWRGEAVAVELLRWIHAGVDRVPLTRIDGSDLWHVRIAVEDDGRFEYKLNIIGAQGESWVLDPRNPHRAGDPFGENSVAMTYGYARPEWSVDRGAPRGSIVTLEIESRVFGNTRHERVYLPHGYDPAHRYPIVVIHDGGDYDDFADLTISLDNLIDTGDIPATIGVLIQADDRMSEYPKGRRHARYLVGDLMPEVTSRYSVSEDPRDRVLLGASLGAVASLATAFRFPGVFGGLILKSGSFILDPEKLRHRPHPVFERVARLVEAVRRAPTPEGIRAFVSTGELEGLAQENRDLAELLRSRGVEVLFQSSWDGHHWHNWRDQLRDALMWVLNRERQD